jgi:hypothetical protein
MKKILLLLVTFNAITFYAQDSIVKLPLRNELRRYLVYLKESPEYKTHKLKLFNKNDVIEIVGSYGDYLAIKSDSLKGYTEKSKFKKGDSLLALFKNKNYIFKRPEIENKCHYFRDEIDEFNGKRKKITESYNLSKVKPFYHGNIHLELRKIDLNKYLRISLSRDLGCAVSFTNDKSWVKFKLENNQIVTFYHRGDVDCGDFSIFARISNNDIKKLKESPIKTIRFQGNKYYHDENSVFWKSFFIDKLDCIN